VIDFPDPCALAEFYCQVPGMRLSEDTGGWVVIGLEPASGSWSSSGSPNGFRHAGLTRSIPSSCTSTFA